MRAAIEERDALRNSNHSHNLDMLPRHLRLIFKPERKARAALKRLAPGQWLWRIEKIPARPLRCRVACIVWWDYFASRTIAERWPHLDKYVEAPFVEFPEDSVRLGLFAVGYTALQAYSRIQHHTYYISQKTKSHANN